MTHNTRDVEEWEQKLVDDAKLSLQEAGFIASSLNLHESGREQLDFILHWVIQQTLDQFHQQLQKAVQEENLKHCCCVIENSKVIERCKLHGDELQKAREDAQAEYKQFVLNVLDGVDIADGQCNTKAIRFALESRIIHSELDQEVSK